MSKITNDTKYHLIGAGIASLSAAVYLVTDGHQDGNKIIIYEESNVIGGAMDGCGNAEDGYMARGGRMFDMENYNACFDMFKKVPSLTNPNKTIMDEFYAFNKDLLWATKCRLVGNNQERIDVSKLGLTREHRLALTDMLLRPESFYDNKRIDECYPPSFFKTPFWYMWTTTFAFNTWHSAIDLKRYMHKFFHELPRIHDMSGIKRVRHNQYESIILPIMKFLEGKGVQFLKNHRVTDMKFKEEGELKIVTDLEVLVNGETKLIKLGENDQVFVTPGSMCSASSIGTHKTPAKILDNKTDGAWSLWKNIAKHSPEFGNPSVFCDNIKESIWQSFTITMKGRVLLDLVAKFTNSEPGRGGMCTFKDSKWLMSTVVFCQPHFTNQPEGVYVMWGYCLRPDLEGDFVKKPMLECTGEEILTEMIGHYGFEAQKEEILKTSICLPCIMPFITAHFMKRKLGDRPQVCPKCSPNLSFLGQFAEVPNDCVFTVDYSVRTAQMAVITRLGLDRPVDPLYFGQYDIRVLMQAAKVLMKDDDIQMEIGLLMRMLMGNI